MKKINLILAAAMAVGASALTGCSSSSKPFDNVDYIAVQENENGKWSFLSPDGTIELSEEFKNEPSMVIEGAFSVKENEGYSVYEFGEKVKVLGDLEKLKSVGHFNDGLMPVTRDKARITIVDKKGKDKFVLEPVKGKEIVSCGEAFSEGMLAIYDQDGKAGFVDDEGKVVVEPKYEGVGDYSDGLAIAVKQGKEGEEKEIVILNKKGDVEFKIRKDQTPIWTVFESGYLAAIDANEHVVLYDKKGETTKLNSKAVSATATDGKNVVFKDSEGLYGVMDIEGEIVIRAKYDNIQIMNNGDFLCNLDDKAVVINDKGEDKVTISDYNKIIELGKFGFWGMEKRTIVKLDEEGKPVKNCEFNNLGISSSADGGYVKSDFFNLEAVVDDVVAMVGDKGIGKYTVGASAATVLSNPEDHLYSSTASFEELKKEGYKYTIGVKASFDGYISDYTLDSWDYSRNYFWNNVKIESLSIDINTQSTWGNEGSEALVKGFQKKGATIIAQTAVDFNSYVAALKYGKIILIISSQKGSQSGTVEMGEYTAEIGDAVKTMIGKIKKDDGAAVQSNNQWESTDAYEYADTTAVAVEPDYYGD